MKCPQCGSSTSVIDSRATEDGFSIRRRRECNTCNSRFSTTEHLEKYLRVIKRNGDIEDFDEFKLEAGIKSALKNRPIDRSKVRELVNKIVAQLLPQRQVTSEVIGLTVLEHLKAIDEVGYMRFASVYKSFNRLEDFQREVRNLEKLDSSQYRSRKRKNNK